MKVWPTKGSSTSEVESGDKPNQTITTGVYTQIVLKVVRGWKKVSGDLFPLIFDCLSAALSMV